MKLKEVTIKKFRNIIDSTPVDVEKDITCLVGKNESGKSSFLNALYRLNPVRKNAFFKIEDQYPAWLEKKDKMKGIELKEEKPVNTSFELEEPELKILHGIFGEGVLKNNILSLNKSYEGTLNPWLNIDEAKYLKNLIQGLSFSKETRAEITNCSIVEELNEFLENYEIAEETSDKEKESIETLKNRIKEQIGDSKKLISACYKAIQKYIPKFIYFDKYSSLPYTVKIKEILQADDSTLDDNLLTAKSLLRMAAADDDYLLNPDYERRKRELENVANALTQDVLEYWSQNTSLRVNPDIDKITVDKPNGQTTVIDELKIRIWDDKHFLSLPFNEHSTGFQWFFSFLAAFSEYEYKDEPVIILLDEPGLGLHGKAQADFLRFIEERLAPKRQVIYTTHSPFMVQPNKLERARIVEEKSRDEGSKVTSDVLTTDPDTLFPLQGALGYDLAQHMFISKNNLILEGTSDYTYIIAISDYLIERGRHGLRPEWTLIPVGGADLIPTFVALLGIHLDLTVVVDARKEGNQKLSNLSKGGYLKSKRIITLNEIVPSQLADIEDLFSKLDYIKLYNDSFEKSHKVDELKGSDQIVNQIARLEGIARFNHGKPADVFLRNRDKYLANLSDETLSNFERLFDRINETYTEK
ncbi:ATP-dependent nuclease [Catalinimonas niigatensis]|uniref:ATP-dependent nuclease n=1 Tax=Catalinimonas niigatensis TaxID=1397264 RepID=UPI0026663337|nr:AAA family ATPase [Catalinimonas niigatensis]WPP51562.1 AAA family ATPase [Catalinimonas niigatensis]